MAWRTIAQIALLLMGLFVWGYGQRVDDPRLTGIGIVFFAVATIFRFVKRKEDPPESPPE